MTGVDSENGDLARADPLRGVQESAVAADADDAFGVLGKLLRHNHIAHPDPLAGEVTGEIRFNGYKKIAAFQTFEEVLDAAEVPGLIVISKNRELVHIGWLKKLD